MTPEEYHDKQENPNANFSMWEKKKRKLEEHEN